MSVMTIDDRISYIVASDDPLSADIGMIRTDGGIWLYDVGNGEKRISGLTDSYHIVLSHFHADHTGNIDRVRAKELYVSGETFRHVHKGTVVDADLYFGDLHIFPLPSCHAKGCLGLEVGETYAFVGDGLYCRVRDGYYLYNAQLLKEEIEVLSALKSPWLLVSHFPGLIRKKDEALAELKTIYQMRAKNTTEIRLPIEPKRERVSDKKE
ncbi:MAG: hypothetical protein IJ240_05970 [Clostridia bacterium]|nr:hypothetical protein [Clostridia bacterium]